MMQMIHSVVEVIGFYSSIILLIVGAALVARPLFLGTWDYYSAAEDKDVAYGDYMIKLYTDTLVVNVLQYLIKYRVPTCVSLISLVILYSFFGINFETCGLTVLVFYSLKTWHNTVSKLGEFFSSYSSSIKKIE